MMRIFYLILLLASILPSLWIIPKINSKNAVSMLFSVFLIVIINFGYFSLSISSSEGEALLAYRIMALESTFLPVFLLFSIAQICHIYLKISHKLVCIFLSLLFLLLKWSAGIVQFYFDQIYFVNCKFGSYLTFTYLDGHYISFIYALVYFVSFFNIINYGLKNKETVPHIYLNYCIVGFGSLVVGKSISFISGSHYSLLPIAYMICEICLLFMQRTSIQYHATEISVLMNKQQKNYGFVTIDMHEKFLDANERAIHFLPMLAGNVIGKPIQDSSPEITNIFLKGLKEFQKTHDEGSKVYRYGTMAYRYSISYFYLYHKKRPSGYLFRIEDDTRQQDFIKDMTLYNNRLNAEVERQTKQILEIQEKVVLGLANIVETRDITTGGHIKRTSDVMRILMQIAENHKLIDVSHEFMRDIVRAAPMHDLGKIIIDSSILCKPGKLTDEEFAIMRSHSAKSGEIVDSILNGVEEQHFVTIAHNVARHHHERWDGRGYPDHLKEEQIPIEARIMAIADVYDALMSKRSYKEAMSFEEVNQIMLSGMGTQFDPSLEILYNLSRPKLEEYYFNLRSTETQSITE